MKRRIQSACAIVCAVLIGLSILRGCGDLHWRSERYVLSAVDSLHQMSLMLDMQNGTRLGLVPSTVYSVGANDTYIVAKQHPKQEEFSAAFDRSVTNFFIVLRSSSPDYSVRKQGVLGPMNKTEFDNFSRTNNLPPFQKTITALE